MGIYVETRIRGKIDDLWQRTQQPDLHQRWDVRFSAIQYLPRPDPALPQQFEYETRIGFGLSIRGTGETTGERETQDGKRTSALRFWSDDPISLITTGSGYWQYLPESETIRFLTWYDYQTRFGLAGRILDRLLFRPLMGWATAWSFDRLRLWIEYDLEPAHTLRQSLLHILGRIGIVLLIGGSLRTWGARRSPVLANGLTLATVLLSLAWPYPDHLPAARRCRRQPQPPISRSPR